MIVAKIITSTGIFRKVKVEINDAAISKSLWLLEKIFSIYYM